MSALSVFIILRSQESGASVHHIRSRKSRAGDENSHEIYVEISAAGSSSSCAGDDVVERLRRSDVIVHVTSVTSAEGVTSSRVDCGTAGSVRRHNVVSLDRANTQCNYNTRASFRLTIFHTRPISAPAHCALFNCSLHNRFFRVLTLQTLRTLL